MFPPISPRRLSAIRLANGTGASGIVATLLGLAPARTALRPAPLRAALGRPLGLPLAALLGRRLPARRTSLGRHGEIDKSNEVTYNNCELHIGEITRKGYEQKGINKRLISPTKRLSGSLAFAMHSYNNGIQLIRTHDVFETRQAITCQETMN